MRLAVRFQTRLTLILALAALLPILMVSLLHLWEIRTAAATERQQAAAGAEMVARLVERELAEARFALGGMVPALDQHSLEAVLADPRYRPFFRALYVTDSHGDVQRYAASGSAAYRVHWDLPAQAQQDEFLLVGAPVAAHPDLPALALARRTGGAVLVAELDTEAIRSLLRDFEAVSRQTLGLAGAGATGDQPAVIASATIAKTPLVIQVIQTAGDLQGTGWRTLWLTLALGALSVTLSIAVARGATEPLSRPFVTRIAESEERLEQMARRLGQSRETLAEVSQQRSVDLVYSRATLYAVMESLNDGLVLITPDDRIRYINRHTEELLRLEEVFYPGRPAEELYAAVAAACEDPGETRGQLSGSAVLTLHSGGRSPRYVRWQTFRIRNATGANLGLGHLLTDVTQEREIDRVKSELISTVSHELRTPLTAIRASASSLLRPGVEWDEETRRDFLTMISEESGHLQELIENLLDMSKIEAGVLRLETYPAEVGRLVNEAAARARALHPDMALTVAVAPGLPLIDVDARRMEQVLLNLLDNAVKYGAGNPVVELQARQQGGEVWLSVHDEGIGIPPEHVDLIFQRFHRVDSRLTRDTGGSGLGLAISRGIVEAHGGRMWAESELGHGSTFFIALPAAREEADRNEVQGAGGGR